MALPPTPPGYNNWNQYIEEQGAIIAAAQGLTFQQGKASVKLLDVAEPVRQAVGTPSYRQYNVFTTWAARQVIPQPTINPDVQTAPGRPWQHAPIPSGTFITLENNVDLITTEVASGSNNIVTE
jgi:hypothetical protein